mgnify:CR=1 FL=1
MGSIQIRSGQIADSQIITAKIADSAISSAIEKSKVYTLRLRVYLPIDFTSNRVENSWMIQIVGKS